MTSSTRPLRREPLLAVPVLMAIGIAIAAYLALVKLKGLYFIDFQSSCNVSQAVNCDAVQRSDHSTVLGVPLSVWAIGTYCAFIALAWVGLRRSQDQDTAAREDAESAIDVLAFGSGLTVLYSVYLAYVQKTQIGASCLFCYGMYATQLGVFVAALVASPKGIGAVAAGARSLFGRFAVLGPAAVAFGVGTAAGLFWYVREEQHLYVAGSDKAIADVRDLMDEQKYAEAIDALGKLTDRTDTYGAKARRLRDEAFARQFGEDPAASAAAPTPAPADAAGSPAVPTAPPPTPSGPAASPAVVAAPAVAQPSMPAPPPAPAGRVPAGSPGKTGGKLTDLGWSIFHVPITDDDFVFGAEDAPITVVEFADFECGYCKMLSETIHTIRDKWKDKARFVFKFYPMDGDCNPRMGGEKMHPDGCTAAKASYCAGKQGKFWEAHDKLFTMQKANQPDKVRGYMGELGVDLAAFDACLASPAPQNRINNDIRLAAIAGINGTPRMYINGRLLSGASSVSIIEYYLQKAGEAPAAVAAPVAAAPTAELSAMVEVTTAKGKVFIDRFEASIDTAGRAVSLPGVKPTQASWFEAKEACEKGGKRLCSEEEWVSACAGTPAVDDNGNGWFNDDTIEGNRYPYGVFYDAGSCHDDQETLTGAPTTTASKTACVTQAGIYDLTGNLSEWIDNDQNRASLVGGNFGTGEGAACNQRGTMFGPGLRNNTTGFRCCADAMVANATTDKAALVAAPTDLVGRPVPDFSIKAADGSTVDASRWKGKVSYVTFFASWCGSCKRELPEVSKWHDELSARGFQVVAIGVDQAQSQSEGFVKQHAPDAKFAVALDPEATAMTEFDIAAMPTSFIVDKTGVIRRKIVGFKKEETAELRAFIEKLL